MLRLFIIGALKLTHSSESIHFGALMLPQEHIDCIATAIPLPDRLPLRKLLTQSFYNTLGSLTVRLDAAPNSPENFMKGVPTGTKLCRKQFRGFGNSDWRWQAEPAHNAAKERNGGQDRGERPRALCGEGLE